MNANQDIFFSKLQEMERQFSTMQSRIRVCGQQDQEKLREELQQAWKDYRADSQALRRRAEESRCRTAAKLAQIQLEYRQQMEALLKNDPPEFALEEAGRAEEVALYAEFAIDAAMQMAQYALIAALAAADLQSRADTEKK